VSRQRALTLPGMMIDEKRLRKQKGGDQQKEESTAASPHIINETNFHGIFQKKPQKTTPPGAGSKENSGKVPLKKPCGRKWRRPPQQFTIMSRSEFIPESTRNTRWPIGNEILKDEKSHSTICNWGKKKNTRDPANLTVSGRSYYQPVCQPSPRKKKTYEGTRDYKMRQKPSEEMKATSKKKRAQSTRK